MTLPLFDLDRRFAELGPKDTVKEDMARVLGRHGQPWDEIANADAVVILAEAGSGKTAEVRIQAQRLRATGKRAAVLRLEVLQRAPVDEAADSPADKASLAQARIGEDVSIFLDALDEARLPQGRNDIPLRAALANLALGLGLRQKRMKLVLTCRGSEWRGEADTRLVTEFLRDARRVGRFAPTAPETELKVRVVRLLPLDRDRVERLADRRGIPGQQFYETLQRARVADLARHPLETDYLIELWRAAMRAGRDPAKVFVSRNQVFLQIAELGLRDSTDGERRSEIAVSRALPAAERLAAAVALTGRQDFSFAPDAIDCLDPVSVLDDPKSPWAEPEARQLLATGLFQPEYRARIRFSHREMQDFLAARFFDRAIRQDAGLTDVIKTLFANVFGTVSIPETSAHCLAWLAGMNAQARTLVREAAPGLLIEEGDPALLNAAERATALRAFIAGYEERAWRGFWFAEADLTRFASLDLVEPVRELLTDTTSSEALEILCDLVTAGGLTDLAPEMLQIAEDVSKANSVRASATDALGAFGSAEQRKRALAGAISSSGTADADTAVNRNKFLAAALNAAFPNAVSVDDALTLVRQLERERRNMTSGIEEKLSAALVRCPGAEVVKLLAGLSKIVAAPRGGDLDKLLGINERYVALISAIAALVIRVLNENLARADDEALHDALELCRFGGGDYTFSRHRDGLDELQAALRQRVDVKLAIFRRRAQLSSKGPRDRAYVAIYPLLRIEDEDARLITFADIEAFANEVRSETAPSRAETAFEAAQLALSSLLDHGAWDRGERVLNAACRAAKTEAMRKRAKPFSMRPLLRLYWRWYHRVRRAFRFRTWPTDLKRIRNRVSLFFDIVRRLPDIRAGRDRTALAWGTRFARNEPGDKTIEGLAKDYGRIIARCFELGYRRMWRLPPLPDGDMRDGHVLAGLTGLALEWTDAQLSLSEEEATIAFKYAFRALTLPSWVDDAAGRYPAAYRAVFRAELDKDGVESNPQNLAADSIRHAAYAGATVQALSADIVLEKLSSVDPADRHSLDVMVALASGEPGAPLAPFVALAAPRFATAIANQDFDRAWIWMHGLLLAAPDQACDTLDQTIFTLAPEPDGPWIGLLAELAERPGGLPARDNWRAGVWQSPRALAWLLRLSYLAAPPATDLVHEDGYSPVARDRAADARRYLAQALVKLATQDAREALKALVDDPLLQSHRDALLSYLDDLSRAAAKQTLIPPYAAVALLRGASAIPATAIEFCELVERHVRGCLVRLRQGEDDEGRRFRVQTATDGDRQSREDDLRDWLSGRLRDLGGGIYDVVRDPKISGARRPDIRLARLETPSITLAIEVKIAESWSGPKHLERIEAQLVGAYMGEARASVGIYVIAHCTEPQRTWQIDDVQQPLDGLAQALIRRGEELCSSRGLERVAVVAQQIFV